MNESKTIRTWLLELPKEISDKAIANAMKHNHQTDVRTRRVFIDTVTKMSLKAAINGSFLFNETPEGGKYWKNITKGIYPKQEEAKPETKEEILPETKIQGVRPPEILAAEIKVETEAFTPEQHHEHDKQQQLKPE